jgi:tetratricopeptide (TPR) repeat protein
LFLALVLALAPAVASVDEAVARGESLLRARRPEEAVREFEHALASSPRSIPALRGLAAAYSVLEDPAAESAYRRLLEAEPGDIRARLELAQFFWRTRRYEEGNRIVEAVVSQPPPKPKLGLEYARVLMAQSRFVQAEREFERACTAARCDADALTAWADALLEAGRFADAAGRYREAIVQSPEKVEPRHRLGRLLLLAGDVASARPELERAAALAPDDAAIRFELGRAQEASGATAEAEASYRAALAKDPELARARHALGTLLNRLGRREEAKREIEGYRVAFAAEQERRTRERTRVAEIDLGWTLLAQKKPAQALAQFERHPRDVEALRGAARALSQLGRKREALAAWDRAIALAPNDVRLPWEKAREQRRGRS